MRKAIVVRRPLPMRKKNGPTAEELSGIMREMPSIEYLLTACDEALENVQLSRLNHARNLEREMQAIEQDRLKALCEAHLAQLIRQYREEIRERTKQASLVSPLPEGESDHDKQS